MDPVENEEEVTSNSSLKVDMIESESRPSARLTTLEKYSQIEQSVGLSWENLEVGKFPNFLDIILLTSLSMINSCF